MEYIGILQSIWTVVAMGIFIAIALWAWSGRRKSEFDEAASLPLDLPVNSDSSKQESPQQEDRHV